MSVITAVFILSNFIQKSLFFFAAQTTDDHSLHVSADGNKKCSSSYLLHVLRVRLLWWLQLLVPPVLNREIIHVSDLIQTATCSWCITVNFHNYWLKTDWTSTRCSRQPNLLCSWFQCCSLSLAIQSSWLITQPIAASGQSQALYDSSQTADRGAHSARLLFFFFRSRTE